MNYNYGLGANSFQNSLQTMLQNQANGLIPSGNAITPLSMVAVSGMEGAKAYQMQPNSAVPLFDNSKDILYIKTTDGANFPTIKTFKLIPYDEEQEVKATYVSRTEFEEFKNEMKTAIKGTKKATKGKDDDE